MCNKLSYCNPRFDKCLVPIINLLNNSNLKTLASCCGHGKYITTIVVKVKLGNIFELYSGISLLPKKRNRYYKRDNSGFYYIPYIPKIV